MNISALGDIGWDNKISSAMYPYYSGYTYDLMVLYGGEDYVQPVFAVPIGYYYSSLPEFNDVASSIDWQ